MQSSFVAFQTRQKFPLYIYSTHTAKHSKTIWMDTYCYKSEKTNAFLILECTVPLRVTSYFTVSCTIVKGDAVSSSVAVVMGG